MVSWKKAKFIFDFVKHLFACKLYLKKNKFLLIFIWWTFKFTFSSLSSLSFLGFSSLLFLYFYFFFLRLSFSLFMFLAFYITLFDRLLFQTLFLIFVRLLLSASSSGSLYLWILLLAFPYFFFCHLPPSIIFLFIGWIWLFFLLSVHSFKFLLFLVQIFVATLFFRVSTPNSC